VSLVSKLKSSPAFLELENNKRLQWMLILIASILMLSLTKSYYDFVEQEKEERGKQAALFQRMQSAANQPLNERITAEVKALYNETFSKLPVAASDSVAQAKALTLMENIIANKIERPRVNVVLSEPLSFGEKNGWQVRLNVSGQMPEKRLIGLLSNISGDKPAIRLLSMQYNPKLSNTLTLVADFLYIEEVKDES
jgi:hypothetical protein